VCRSLLLWNNFSQCTHQCCCYRLRMPVIISMDSWSKRAHQYPDEMSVRVIVIVCIHCYDVFVETFPGNWKLPSICWCYWFSNAMAMIFLSHVHVLHYITHYTRRQVSKVRYMTECDLSAVIVNTQYLTRFRWLQLQRLRQKIIWGHLNCFMSTCMAWPCYTREVVQ